VDVERSTASVQAIFGEEIGPFHRRIRSGFAWQASANMLQSGARRYDSA